MRLAGMKVAGEIPGVKLEINGSFANKAREKLKTLVLGHEVVLKYGGQRLDRYGRRLAQVFREDGGEQELLWVQGEMIAAGLARVVSFADNRACIGPLLELERPARKERRGIWADPFYAVLPASQPGLLAKKSGQFQIVRGHVVAVARRGKRIFLNFDDNWKRDFTIVIASRHWRSFAKKGLDLDALKGRELQVRGWVRMWNGPMIEVDHPEQIELLD